MIEMHSGIGEKGSSFEGLGGPAAWLLRRLFMSAAVWLWLRRDRGGSYIRKFEVTYN